MSFKSWRMGLFEYDSDIKSPNNVLIYILHFFVIYDTFRKFFLPEFISVYQFLKMTSRCNKLYFESLNIYMR